jgi:hypothetical protein
LCFAYRKGILAEDRKMRRFAAVALVLALCGCADTADVFPANEAAHRLGPVKASFVRTGVGRGPITITMADG